MGTLILLPPAMENSVSNKHEGKVDLLSGLDSVTFDMPTHRSDHTAKSHPSLLVD
jgi:hypothetical protein